MSDRDCEKIIDQAVERNGADHTAEAHARTCPKCASTLALLALLKTSGSPTADLKPSAAFLGRIESSLATSAAGAAQSGILKSKLLAAVIGVALTAAVAWTIVAHSKKSDAQNAGAQTSSTEVRANPDAANTDNNNIGIKPGEDDNAFPQLQFPAPTDEIK
ncbi:MAG: hypothetical protein ACD_39C00620G0003 [uncultured bacterium]|nr:MAG: hypothetical protein ACD_39C00620G0003 [uncultured bacterium]